MASRIDMELMRHAALREHPVERPRAGIKAEVVFVPTIEIDLHASKICGAGHGNGAVLLPEGGIGRIAEDTPEHARTRGIGCRTREKSRQLVDQRGAVGTHGRKKLRATERQVQSSIAAHGNTRDGPIGTTRRDPVTFFDVRKEFLHQKILVAVFAVSCVDIKTGSRLRSRDQKISQFAFVAHVFDEIPRTRMDEKLFVLSQAVEEIQNWEVPGLVRVERWR